jgi:hypothetical protein
MQLISLRVPIAGCLGATLMAWRAYEVAPPYTAVQIEMMNCIAVGALLLTLGGVWEFARWYQRMDRHLKSGGRDPY